MTSRLTCEYLQNESRYRQTKEDFSTTFPEKLVNMAAHKRPCVCVVGKVYGVTQLHDVVYVVCQVFSTISRFNAATRQRLTDIRIKTMKLSWDIAACERTRMVYVADDEKYVWRVSADGTDIKRWLPKSLSDRYKPWSLSVTSTRLLVTSHYTLQLIQFDADGDELRRVQLQRPLKPQHAVESPAGTFIVGLYNIQLKKGLVGEVNTGGEVLRQFSGSRLISLYEVPHVAVDSHGNILVADVENRQILLLDDHLSLRRVIIDEHQLNYKQPWRLCYREDKGQLLVALDDDVAVFDVLCR